MLLLPLFLILLLPQLRDAFYVDVATVATVDNAAKAIIASCAADNDDASAAGVFLFFMLLLLQFHVVGFATASVDATATALAVALVADVIASCVIVIDALVVMNDD